MSERPDVEIGEVNTRIEVTDRAQGAQPDLNRLAELVLNQLSEERRRQAMRDDDGRIRDRSWLSDVKPD